jgi:hypothetical protein
MGRNVYIGRIWQFNREINIKTKGPNTKKCAGNNFTTTANTKDRWELDLIGRARNIWWKYQVRAPSVGHTYAEYWDWPTPFSTTMTPATTREYKEREKVATTNSERNSTTQEHGRKTKEYLGVMQRTQQTRNTDGKKEK